MDEKHVARLWDANARVWASGVRRGLDRYRSLFHDPAFFALVGEVKGLRVLDVACGEGISTRRLAQEGAHVTGIDLSREMVDYARALEAPDGVSYEVDTFTELTTQASSAYDLVVSIMALMDSPGLDATVSAIRRVLKPRGRFVFSVTHPFTDKPGTTWNLGTDGKPNSLVVRDYFAEEPWEDVWSFAGDKSGAEPFRIPTFPRTLSTYLDTLTGSGFGIERCAEPRPSEEAARANDDLYKWRIAPFYLMVAATAVP